MLTILQGDVMEQLQKLPECSVQCCVTSPPYWGLRDYGVPGQLGLEKTPEEYVAKIVAVFREVRRVLKDDGTCWINLGDSYAGGNGIGRNDADRNFTGGGGNKLGSGNPGRQGSHSRDAGLKQKDLVGIPWMVAFALRADGWYLRQDIIWSKPNPMPESVRDRCTKAHEYVFLLSKSQRYFYDAAAIREKVSENTNERRKTIKMPDGWDTGPGGHGTFHRNGREKGKTRKLAENGSGVKNNASFDDAMAVMPDERNKRSVWSVCSYPFPDAHFATYPPDLIKPCILAGCPVGGSVLDPFAGSGTTGMVAIELGRKAVLIELNPEYVKLIERRCDVTPGLALTA